VAKLIAWGSTFDESRRRMSNALDEFIIDGINTTIPLYKTIMNDGHFINGELSTDYLDRFSIIEKMNSEIKNKFKDKDGAKVLPGVAAVILHSEYVKLNNNRNNNPNAAAAEAGAASNVSSANRNSWKFGGANN